MTNGETNYMLTRIQTLLAIATVVAAGFAGYMNQTATMMVDGVVSTHNTAEVVHVQATGKHNDRADSHYANRSLAEKRLDRQERAVIKIEGHVEQLRSDMAEQKIDMRDMKNGQQEILLYIKSIAPPGG